jgi:hypothetical protein
VCGGDSYVEEGGEVHRGEVEGGRMEGVDVVGFLTGVIRDVTAQ